MSAEDLFDAEQKLRDAALVFADWDTPEPRTNPTRQERLKAVRKALRAAASRKALRAAAIFYADLAKQVK